MQWKKLGIVWRPSGDLWWAKEYATCPTPFLLENGNLRIYIQGRDSAGVGRIGYIEVDPTNPLKILQISKEPVLNIGRPGMFDDNGVFPTSVITAADGRIFMYYVGFEICHHIRYRLLTGLACSEDNGETFFRIKSTPILERSETEMFFRCGPFVLYSPNRGYQMWYIAGSDWINIDSKPMPVYDLRYIESQDGIKWPDQGRIVLQINEMVEHGFGRPYLMNHKNHYQLFYSIRKKAPCAYRLGYAESPDGISWQRKDEELGLDVSTNDWDSDSIEYSAIVPIGKKTYCFYNGNDFGKTGFGVAELLQ